MEDIHSHKRGASSLRSLSTEAPWQWLSKGWADIWRSPAISLGYGAVFVLGGYAITLGLWQAGLSAMIPVAAGMFALIGPMMAVGLYELSRRYESGESFALKDIIFVKTQSPIQIAYIGFLMMFSLLFWARIAMILYALFANTSYMPLSQFTEFVLQTADGLMLLIVGTIIGAGIALAIFAMTAFSIPMLMDRKTNSIEAIVYSVRVFNKEPGVMLQWAWLIVALLATGVLTAFAGLIVIFPLLGHATWHAYRDVFCDDAS